MHELTWAQAARISVEELLRIENRREENAIMEATVHIDDAPINITLCFENVAEVQDLLNSLKTWTPQGGWSVSAQQFFEILRRAIDQAGVQNTVIRSVLSDDDYTPLWKLKSVAQAWLSEVRESGNTAQRNSSFLALVDAVDAVDALDPQN